MFFWKCTYFNKNKNISSSIMRLKFKYFVFTANISSLHWSGNAHYLFKTFSLTYFVCLFVYSRPSNFFSHQAAVTITGDRAANFGLCSALKAFEQGGILILPHLLRHGTSVYTVSSERPPPTSHSGIRTPNSRIISLTYSFHDITFWLLNEMTKITISNQSRKSKRKYKSENGSTRTSEYIRGGIRCHGGVSIPFWPVTPAVSPISTWIITYMYKIEYTGPRYILFHLKDRHPRPTVGFEPGTQG
jgi:hypothetical protein